MKTILATLFLFISIGASAQTRIGTIGAFQIYNNEVHNGDMILYYPKEPVRIEGALWLTVELQTQNLSTFLEITKENRKKITEILEAYQKLKNVLETPKKLPGSYSIGQVNVRSAFADSSKIYHLSNLKNILFYVKFDKNGNKTLAMAIGKLTSKTHPTTTHSVPLLWFNDAMVADFLSEISEGNIASFKRNKGKTIDPAALELLHNE